MPLRPTSLLPVGTVVRVRWLKKRAIVAAWGKQDSWQVPVTIADGDGRAMTVLRSDLATLPLDQDPILTD